MPVEGSRMSSERPPEPNTKLPSLEKEPVSPSKDSPAADPQLSSETLQQKSEGEERDEEFPFEQQPTTLLAIIKYRLARLNNWIRSKRLSLFGWLNKQFGQLTFSQWCYFVAFVVLINQAGDGNNDDQYYLTVGIIAGLGLIRELWQVFAKIWEHMLGKGILLILYAATANFALAISALKINSISGVEPYIFVFTMGFTTLLMLPFWILTASIIFLGSAIVIGNLWLLFGLLLRIVGIKIKLHWEDQSFAVITMIFRFVLIPFLIYVLLQIMNPYLKQMDMFEVPLGLTMFENGEAAFINAARFNTLSKQQLSEIAQHIRSDQAEPITAELQQKMDTLALSDMEKNIIYEMSDEDLVRLIDRVKQSSTDDTLVNMDSEAGNNAAAEAANSDTGATSISTQDTAIDAPVDETNTDAAETRVLDNLIARFIYRFETYPYSSCAKEEHQRVLPFEEDKMLVAEQDDSKELGIKFYVAACEPVYNIKQP